MTVKVEQSLVGVDRGCRDLGVNYIDGRGSVLNTVWLLVDGLRLVRMRRLHLRRHLLHGRLWVVRDGRVVVVRRRHLLRLLHV